MSYTVEQLLDLPVVVLRFHADFDALTELLDAIAATDVLMLQINAPLYYVCDATLAPPPTMKSLIEGSNGVVKRPNFKVVQPLIQEIILISPNKAVQLAAVGLNTEAFGWLRIKVFPSYDSALDYLGTKFSETFPSD